MRRMLFAVLVLGSALSARAANLEYTFQVADSRDGSFEIPFAVAYPGTIVLDAQWSGPRVVYFRIDAPGHPGLRSRTGVSPEHLDLPVASQAGSPATYTLFIKALPAHSDLSGHITLSLPDAPAVVAKREAELHPPPPLPPPPPSYALKKEAPELATVEVGHVFAAVEVFRARVFAADDPREDACAWQTDFLKFAAEARDRLAEGKPPLDTPSVRYLRRVAAAIGSVERLRTSRDPLLAGPVPQGRDERRDWLIGRSELIRPIERSLDELTEMLRSGFAPALEEERWLPRMTACLTACERFFDERVRLDGDGSAPNKDLAAAQWDRIVAAGAVLDALGAAAKEPAGP